MAVPSPCIKVCLLDAQRRYCTGCYRTLAEIAGWGSMSDDDRRRVVAQLDERRRQYAPAS